MKVEKLVEGTEEDFSPRPYIAISDGVLDPRHCSGVALTFNPRPYIAISACEGYGLTQAGELWRITEDPKNECMAGNVLGGTEAIEIAVDAADDVTKRCLIAIEIAVDAAEEDDAFLLAEFA